MKIFIRTICLIFWLQIFNGVSAQFPVDSVFESSASRKIYYNDICYSFVVEGSNYLILKDTLPLGYVMPRFRIKSYYYDKENNTINIITDGNTARLISIKFQIDAIITEEFSNLSNICIFKDRYYFNDNKTGEVVIINKNTTNKEIFSVSQIFNKTDQFKPLFVAKLNQDSTLIASGYFGDGEYYSVEYNVIDDETRLYRTINPIGKLGYIFTESVAILDYYSINNDYAFCVGGILDKNYNFYTNCLQKKIKIQDIVIQDNQIKQIIVLSSLDEYENKWSNTAKIVKIVAVPSPEFENLMYEVYNGIELQEQEIKNLTLNQLNLLKNMAYAKYNLKFNDNYLTAYFNLYYFYLNQRSSRKLEVDNFLTEIDKKNIALIKSLL